MKKLVTLLGTGFILATTSPLYSQITGGTTRGNYNKESQKYESKEQGKTYTPKQQEKIANKFLDKTVDPITKYAIKKGKQISDKQHSKDRSPIQGSTTGLKKDESTKKTYWKK